MALLNIKCFMSIPNFEGKKLLPLILGLVNARADSEVLSAFRSELAAAEIQGGDILRRVNVMVIQIHCLFR